MFDKPAWSSTVVRSRRYVTANLRTASVVWTAGLNRVEPPSVRTMCSFCDCGLGAGVCDHASRGNPVVQSTTVNSPAIANFALRLVIVVPRSCDWGRRLPDAQEPGHGTCCESLRHSCVCESNRPFVICGLRAPPRDVVEARTCVVRCAS